MVCLIEFDYFYLFFSHFQFKKYSAMFPFDVISIVLLQGLIALLKDEMKNLEYGK